MLKKQPEGLAFTNDYIKQALDQAKAAGIDVNGAAFQPQTVTLRPAARNSMLTTAWPDILDRLDRHRSSGRLSPDVATLADLMDTYRVPGISIAVGRAGEQVWAAGYGSTDAARSTPVDSRTAFQACSISKHVAAFGTLRLVAAGTLDLDSDIHEYLTSWRLPDGEGGRAT